MPDDRRALPEQATCCIVGGGPAGIMLGFLLARAGVDVAVLEKHKDFLRDFRGDTIHASTLELMRELGLLQDFLRLPHEKVESFTARFGREDVRIGDFTHLPTHCKFVAFMPQWHFLDFLAGHGRRHAGFNLQMETEATGLIVDGSGRIAGVRVQTPAGAREIRADLVVACDGRHSLMRQQSGLPLTDYGAPIDVLWFRIPRRDGDPQELLGRVDYGHALVLIDRGAYWQCAYIIAKGSLDALKRRGLAALQAQIAQLAPFAADRLDMLDDWEKLKLLSVQVNRLQRWHRPGLLCIGDAAHAMSPVGGVGINLAIQDAVAAANLLHAALRARKPVDPLLQRVQQRRFLPTWLVQRFQVMAHGFLARHVLTAQPDRTRNGALAPPWPLRLITRLPVLRQLLPRFVAVGYRPEHIATPQL
ncbi:MAG TPA: FAD-dependent oxidoreductase [Ferrovibrio sp.]|uniref:FAD-dependent oxidoreductase n=1 Tax=Ferrovibrio sp. TaxID=1917215 RepID=UPI002ED04B4D